MSMLGNLGSAAMMMFCWVAREIYSEKNPAWLMVRNWIFTKGSQELRDLYAMIGEDLAANLHRMPQTRARLEAAFNLMIQGELSNV